jgi:hypothetical protein
MMSEQDDDAKPGISYLKNQTTNLRTADLTIVLDEKLTITNRASLIMPG